MAHLTWKKDLDTGIEVIDGQHNKLSITSTNSMTRG